MRERSKRAAPAELAGKLPAVEPMSIPHLLPHSRIADSAATARWAAMAVGAGRGILAPDLAAEAVAGREATHRVEASVAAPRPVLSSPIACSKTMPSAAERAELEGVADRRLARAAVAAWDAGAPPVPTRPPTSRFSIADLRATPPRGDRPARGVQAG